MSNRQTKGIIWGFAGITVLVFLMIAAVGIWRMERDVARNRSFLEEQEHRKEYLRRRFEQQQADELRQKKGEEEEAEKRTEEEVKAALEKYYKFQERKAREERLQRERNARTFPRSGSPRR